MVQLQATYLPNMAKNSAAQYEVVAVDVEDGVQWQLWWGCLLAVAAFDGVEDYKVRQWQGKDGV